MCDKWNQHQNTSLEANSWLSLQAYLRLFIYKQIQGFLYEQIDFKGNLYLAYVAIYLSIYHELIEAQSMNLIYARAKSSL
jgi:hypothetical protein